MMKSFFFFLLSTCFLNTALKAQGTLFFSEYIEGSSNNKALEIYNGTDSTVDLQKEMYVVQFYFNGASTSTTFPLTSILAAGDVFVFVSNGFALALDSTLIDKRDASKAGWFNGDDAIALRKGGATGPLIDVIGQIGVDPGTAWNAGGVSTLDRTLVRKPEISKGDTIGTDSFDPSQQWVNFPQDDISHLGQHNALFTLSTTQLSFASPGVGIASASQSYTLKTTGSTLPVQVAAQDASFGISSSATGPFLDSLVISPEIANQGITLFVQYLPHTSNVLSSSLLHRIGLQRASIQLKGEVFTVTHRQIGEVQGDSSVSRRIGEKVAITGVVTLDAQKAEELKGFYLQDASDHNPLTSDGIFIYDNLFGVDVKKGWTVRVEGEVAETFGQTQLHRLLSVTVLAPTPAFALDTATLLFPLDSVASLEKYEGHLVKLPQKMVVTETYNLGRYGELTLSAGDRLYQPTEKIDLNDSPSEGTASSGQSNLQAVLALQQLNDRSKITLADKLSSQNPNPIPFLDPIKHTIRSGTSLVSLTGVIGFEFGGYRVYADTSLPFDYAPRPEVPTIGNPNVVVAGMNVLNFFNGDGFGTGFPTSRGAVTHQEFKRQKSKIVAAIKTLQADAIGLMEIENDEKSTYPALQELIDSVNIGNSIGSYTSVAIDSDTNGNAGTDEIKLAIMYRPSVLAPMGSARYFNHASFDNIGRPPLAQTFQHIASGEIFTMIVNHFKSKGCTDAGGDNTDQLDGQGCYTATRKKQAEALASFIASLQKTSGDSDIVTLGDFNSYGQEDPLDVLRAKGLIDLTHDTYSYVFNAQFGSLDHAFASPSMKKQVTGASKWHINADEPPVLDYTLSFKTQDVYQPNPYRSSDHDPVVIGLALQPTVSSIKPTYLTSTWQIVPNPISGKKIQTTAPISGQLFDVYGHAILYFENQHEIQVDTLPKGVYYLKAVEGNTVKVVIP